MKQRRDLFRSASAKSRHPNVPSLDPLRRGNESLGGHRTSVLVPHTQAVDVQRRKTKAACPPTGSTWPKIRRITWESLLIQ
jgi:hypothetical protein